MVSHQWKAHERFVAKALQGKRIPRGANFSRSLPDVIADASLSIPGTKGLIFAECKYSINNPWVSLISDIYKNKLIIVPVQSRDCFTKSTEEPSLILFELGDIKELNTYPFLKDSYKKLQQFNKKVPDYILNNLTQSRDYLQTVVLDPVTKASIQAITNLDILLPKLPIVVIAEKSKSFRLAYTSNIDLDIFYRDQNNRKL